VGRVARRHSSRDFETELRELQAHILAMGARCERIVGLAFEGFLAGTSDVLRDVEALDKQIDRDEVEIHALILRILALRQPVADDLRSLATAVRIITDLERIGDEAVNIAERAVDGTAGARDLVLDDLRSMARTALDMLHLALDAFVRGDDGQAARILELDDDVDRRCAATIAAMTTYMSEHVSQVPFGLRAIWVSKYLERIADHATNVAEEVIFVVRAIDVRHGQWQRAAE
jgi:phosphate transport system protein